MATVFMTGATGTMGMAALREITSRSRHPQLILLARDSKKNRKKLAPFLRDEKISVIWGDLQNKADIVRGVSQANLVIHVGGMVSPAADYEPDKTMKVNVGAVRNIVSAVRSLPDPSQCGVVYIGSVSQYGPRLIPDHWLDASDQMRAEKFGTYGLSKILAERELAESGLPKWVSLRLGAILSGDLLKKATDPITFHVPLRGVLEWTTDSDCGRLIANLAETELPAPFWRRFYNIGSGSDFRLTYLDFETKFLKVMGCPSPQKVFETNWFAFDNFHGGWFRDSDILNEWLHFRGEQSADAFFREMAGRLPFYYKLAPLAPAFAIKIFMKMVARKWPFGPLAWVERSRDTKAAEEDRAVARKRVDAFFGSYQDWKKAPGWKAYDGIEKEAGSKTDYQAPRISNDKPLTLETAEKIARERGGKLIEKPNAASGGEIPDENKAIEWECQRNHRFRLTPCSVIRGGHWCEECLKLEKEEL